MKPRLSACAILSLLFLMTACVPPPAPPVERPAPVPLDFAALKQRSDHWRDYRAKIRLRVESKKAKFGVRAVVLVKGRNFARFETFTPIGQTATLFVLNNTGPSLFIPSEKVIFKASNPETLIGYFLGVSLQFDAFRSALSASIPADLLEGVEMRAEGGVPHAFRSAGTRSFDWRFLANGTGLTGMHVRDDQFEADIVYEPPVSLTTPSVPDKILISSPEWKMEVNVEEIQPALEFQPSVFYLPNMPQMKMVDLDKVK